MIPGNAYSSHKGNPHEEYGYFLKKNDIFFNSTPTISNCFSPEGSNLLYQYFITKEHLLKIGHCVNEVALRTL